MIYLLFLTCFLFPFLSSFSVLFIFSSSYFSSCFSCCFFPSLFVLFFLLLLLFLHLWPGSKKGKEKQRKERKERREKEQKKWEREREKQKRKKKKNIKGTGKKNTRKFCFLGLFWGKQQHKRQQQKNNNNNQTTKKQQPNNKTTEQQQQQQPQQQQQVKTLLNYKNRHSRSKKTQNFAICRQKASFIHTSIFKLLTAQKSGRKSRATQNAIKLQKQAFQKIRTQNFAKCRKKASFKHTNIFKLVHVHNPCTMWPPQNPIFIRATPCRSGFAPNCPVHKFRFVFLQNRALEPGQFVTFWPFLLLPHLSSEMPIFIVWNTCGPRTGFMVDPEPARFWEKRGPISAGFRPSGMTPSCPMKGQSFGAI